MAGAAFFEELATEETGHTTIKLERKKGWRGFLGGSIKSRARDRVVMDFRDMRRALEFEITRGNLSVCCALVFSVLYPAMGGTLSEVLCSLVTGHFELRVQARCLDLGIASALIPMGYLPTDCFQGTAHVDDLGVISASHCSMCCFLHMQALLPEGIGYEYKGGFPAYKFLQTALHFQGPEIFLYPYNPNIAFIEGPSDGQEVTRCRPALGTQSWSHGQLRSYIRQRMATHRQVAPGDTPQARTVVVEADKLMVKELMRLGYSSTRLHRVWAALPPAKADLQARIVRQELKKERKNAQAQRGR